MCPAKKQKKKKKTRKGKSKNLKLTEFADEPECEVAYGDYCSLKRLIFIKFLYVHFPQLVAVVEFRPGCLA